MDYLKLEGSGVIETTAKFANADSFDTHGLMARFKVTSGTVYVCCKNTRPGEKTPQYPVETGETIDFVGKIWFYGTGRIEYLLFDRA